MSTYREAGVDLEAADRAVALIRAIAAGAGRPEVVSGVGGFAGAFRLPGGGDGDGLLLAAACDGVGTKLLVAEALGRFDTIGVDLVAMNANDLVVHGAEPLFFLDYVACGRLEPERVAEVVRGVAEGCRQAGMALLGGETAELPGLLPPGRFELAGFAVGVCRERDWIDGRRVRPGDAVLGLPSSGLHSNGYALARRVLLERAGLRLDAVVPELGEPLGEVLLRPTRIYVRAVRALLGALPVGAMAHITGGGLPGNVPRTLPPGCAAVLREGTWEVPPVFRLIAGLGRVEPEEMRRTFNLGIGMTAVVPAEHADAARRLLAEALGEPVPVIGEVVAHDGPPEVRWA